jgi:hypothetical protein
MVTEIANARVPDEIKPLLMDAKLIGLQKGSNMQNDIARSDACVCTTSAWHAVETAAGSG